MSPELNIGAISRGAIVSILLQMAGLALAYLAQLLIARWLGAAEYGRYAYVVTIGFFLSAPLQLGLNIGLLRFLSHYRVGNDFERASGFLRRAYQLPVGLASLLAVVVACLALTPSSSDWEYARPLAIGIFALPVLVASAISVHAGRALGHFAWVKAVQDIGQPLLLITAVALVAAFGGVLTSTPVLAAYVVTATLIAGAQGMRIYRTLPVALRHARPRYETKAWLCASLPFVLTASTLVVMQQSDVLMVGVFMKPADVGVYAVAVKLSTLVTLMLMGVNMLAAPAYATLFAENDRAAMQTLARKLAHLTFWPALAIALVLLLFGRWLLSWFGDDFTLGYPVVLILATAALVNVGTGSVGYLAGMAGQQWAAARVQGLAAGLNILLNLLLIPRYGLEGGAAATAIAVIVSNVWLHAVVANRVGVRAAIIFAMRTPKSR